MDFSGFPQRRSVLLFSALAFGCVSESSGPGTRPGVVVYRTPVLHPWARLPEADPAFGQVDVTRDALLYTFEGAPELALDVGDVVMGAAGGGYLRRIRALRTRSDGAVVAETSPARLCEFFEEAHVRVSGVVGAEELATARAAPPGDPLPTGAGAVAQPLLGADDIDIDIDFHTAYEVAPFEDTVLSEGGAFDLAAGGVGDWSCSFAGGGGVNLSPILRGRVEFDLEIEITGACVERFCVQGMAEAKAGAAFAVAGAALGECEIDFLADAAPLTFTSTHQLPTLGGLLPVPVPLVLRHSIVPSARARVELAVEPTCLAAEWSVGHRLEAGFCYTPATGFSTEWNQEDLGRQEITVGQGGMAELRGEVVGGLGYEIAAEAFGSVSLGLEARVDARATTSDALCSWEGEARSSLSATLSGTGVAGGLDERFELAAAVSASEDGSLPWCGGGDPSPEALAACDGAFAAITACESFETLSGILECLRRADPDGAIDPAASAPGEELGYLICRNPPRAKPYLMAHPDVRYSRDWNLDAVPREPDVRSMVEALIAGDAIPGAKVVPLRKTPFYPEDAESPSGHVTLYELLPEDGSSDPNACLKALLAAKLKQLEPSCYGGRDPVDYGGGLLLCQVSYETPVIPLASNRSIWSHPMPLERAADALPLFISNNPETVYTHGVLASTRISAETSRVHPEEAVKKYAQPVDRARVPRLEPRDVIGHDDQGCTEHRMRHFGIYLAHIPKSTSAAGYIGLAVEGPPGASVSVRGELLTSGWNVEAPTFVSAVAAGAWLNGTAPSRTLTIPPSGFLSLGTVASAGYVDGRLEVQSEECLHVHSFSTPSAAPTSLPGGFAQGNPYWPGWNGSSSAMGTAGGVASHDHLSGRQGVHFGRANEQKGYGLLLPVHSSPLVLAMNDGAEAIFGNYGVRHTLDFDLSHDNVCGGGRLNVQVEIVGYATLQGEQAPSYGAYFREEGHPYRRVSNHRIYWNAPWRITTPSGSQVLDTMLQPPQGTGVAIEARHGGQASDAAPSVRRQLGIIPVGGSDTVSIRLEAVPAGLLSAPLAVVFTGRCEDGAAPPPPAGDTPPSMETPTPPAPTLAASVCDALIACLETLGDPAACLNPALEPLTACAREGGDRLACFDAACGRRPRTCQASLDCWDGGGGYSCFSSSRYLSCPVCGDGVCGDPEETTEACPEDC